MSGSAGADAPNHAALMDGVYRYQRYIYDFTRKYYLFGRDRLIRELALGPDEHLIEIGCGTARNLILIAKRYPGARLYGVDASHEMLKTARQQVERAGLSGRIALAHGYAEQLTPALFGRNEGFDRAIFSYSLSMIPDWRGALAAANVALKPSGWLHIVDFGDLTGLGRIGQAVMRGWLRLFHVEPRVAVLNLLENGPAPAGDGQIGRLSLLPGRYAFLFSCLKDHLPAAPR